MCDSLISIGRPRYKDGHYEVNFSVPNKIQKFFRTTAFLLECPDAGKVPDSIIAIPIVANLIPFAWIFDCELKVESLDKEFYLALPEIKKGYINMLPKLNFAGSIEINNIVDNSKERGCGSPLLLFSGGVDAWCTLTRHIDEHPWLVSIWGADIRCSNITGWRIVDDYSKDVARSLNIGYSYVKSNFWEMINYRILDSSPIMTKAGYGWWHDVQHGIALLSLTSPLAYAKKSRIVYIASSNTEKDKGKYVCASDPTIDNHFAAFTFRASHDGYELTRQDKVDTIVRYAKKTIVPVNLRVCFNVQSGRNCCRCEKCGRTILEILAAKGDPLKLGFEYNQRQFDLLMNKMHYILLLSFPFYYHDVANAVKARGIKLPNSARWVLSDKLDKICNNRFKFALRSLRKFGGKIYHAIIGK